MPGVYAMSFDALSARNVSGTVAFQTDQGWYSVPFDNVPLTEFDQQWKAKYVEFTRKSFTSDDLFVRFPRAVNLQSAFVNDAQTKGDTVFGWDAKGRVSCAGLSAKQFSEAQRPQRLATLLNPRPTQTPEATTSFLTPAIASAPGLTACAVPFADASVPHPGRVTYPEAAKFASVQSANVLVEVAVSAAGQLEDSWIYAPSGNRYFDDAAMEVTHRSTYAPRRSFCQDVPGLYLFRVEFEGTP